MKEKPIPNNASTEVSDSQKIENNVLKTDKKLLNLIAEAIVEIIIKEVNESDRLRQDQ